MLGVDYIFGHAESTGGLLWVVGKDPDLFNYFLPERWRRTPKKKLSSRNQVFYTRTKDNINLVWRVSRMGDTPWLTNPEAHQEAAQAHGFNSPFEEFAFALELSRNGREHHLSARHLHDRPQARAARQAAGRPALRRAGRFAHARTASRPSARSSDYITIWGFWNGPDELLAAHDGQFLPGHQRQARLRPQADLRPAAGMS